MKKNRFVYGFLSIFLLLVFKIAAQPTAFKGDYAYNTIRDGGSALVTTIGYVGQEDAPLIDEKGRLYLESTGLKVDNFGLFNNRITNSNWKLEDGYLPISVYSFKIPNFDVVISYLVDVPNTTNHSFLYVQMMLKYTGSNVSGVANLNIGAPSQLVPINNLAKTIGTGNLTYDISTKSTIVLEYAVNTEGVYTKQQIQQNAKEFLNAKSNVKSFWNNRINNLAALKIPASVANSNDIVNAYKSSVIFLDIIRDDKSLKIGENGYDFVYDHDAHGMLATAIEMGYYSKDEALNLLLNLPAQQSSHDYIDALMKIFWVTSKYIHKYNVSKEEADYLIFQKKFIGSNYRENTLKDWMKYFIANKLDGDGLATGASTLDSYQRSSVDNFAALLGLKSYELMCRRAGNSAEAVWALSHFLQIKIKFQAQLVSLMNNTPEKYKYVSAFINKKTEEEFSDWKNANVFSHFFFGRMYELFLLGEELKDIKPYIDQTLDRALLKTSSNAFFREQNANGGYDWNGNFGDFGMGFVTTGYNASYAEGLLLGNGKYRDSYYKAFDWMLKFQSGPYTWFESIGEFKEFDKITINGKMMAAGSGHGSAPHMWSSMSQSRLALLNMISESYDKNIIIGRGIPSSWLQAGDFGVSNYRLQDGRKFGYNIKSIGGNKYEITFNGSNSDSDVIVNLPAFLEQNVSVVNYDGVPSNYFSMVKSMDYDNDGLNEIKIFKGYDQNYKIVFSLEPRQSNIGNTFIKDGYYFVKNKKSGLYLDVKDGNLASGTPIWQYDFNKTEAQIWKVTYNSIADYYTITSVRTGKALDIRGGNVNWPVQLQQYDGSPSNNAQKWKLISKNGAFQVESIIGNPLGYLGIENKSTANKSLVQIQNLENDNSQLWEFIPINSLGLINGGIYRIKNTNSGNFMDVKNGSTITGNEIWQYSGNQTSAQLWQAKYDPKTDAISFISLLSRKALDIRGGNTAWPVQLQQYDFGNYNLSQKWKLIPFNGNFKIESIIGKPTGVIGVNYPEGNSQSLLKIELDKNSNSQAWEFILEPNRILNDDIYFIQNVNNGKFLDVSNGSKESGASIWQYTLNGTDAQKWRSIYDPNSNSYSFISLRSGKALDIRGGSTAWPVQLQQYDYSFGNVSQNWKLIPFNGNFIIESVIGNPNGYVGVENEGVADQTLIQIQENINNSQIWSFVRASDFQKAKIGQTVSNDIANSTNVQNLDNFNSEGEVILVYPSPSKGIIKVMHSESIDELEVNNLLGVNVFRSNTINSREIEVNTDSFKEGMYVLTITNRFGFKFSKKIYIQN